jgi:hypothetical protein
MARYSVLRLMIFFGLLCALWLLGLRAWLLLVVSGLGSMVVSYFVLQGPRAQFSASIARRVDQHGRRAGLAQAHDTDENVEDTQADAQADEDAGKA